jgi:hypothetical protein
MKLAATAPGRCCNKLQVRAARRDKPVLPLVLATVAVISNDKISQPDLLAA